MSLSKGSLLWQSANFPWLSGAGRLVVKDLALFAGG
ncbi:DUF417 family protein, partial [Helicobacter pylori]